MCNICLRLQCVYMLKRFHDLCRFVHMNLVVSLLSFELFSTALTSHKFVLSEKYWLAIYTEIQIIYQFLWFFPLKTVKSCSLILWNIEFGENFNKTISKFSQFSIISSTLFTIYFFMRLFFSLVAIMSNNQFLGRNKEKKKVQNSNVWIEIISIHK